MPMEYYVFLLLFRDLLHRKETARVTTAKILQVHAICELGLKWNREIKRPDAGSLADICAHTINEKCNEEDSTSGVKPHCYSIPEKEFGLESRDFPLEKGLRIPNSFFGML